MERYGGESEELHPDPSPEWSGTGAETGLEEATWQLELGSAKSYPERPDEADCLHYLRTGYCGYGSRCRFNHPPDRGAVIMGSARHSTGDYPERVGQPICQYYMRTGSCKFGSSCKFNHPKQGSGSPSPVSLNYYGYPVRQGEKDCSYYMKTGQCKFGATCKFHHPQPYELQASLTVPQGASVPGQMAAPALYHSMSSSSAHSSQQYGVLVSRPSYLPYVQGPYGPVLLSPSMVPYPGWNPYQASVSPASPNSQPPSASSSLYGPQLSPSILPGQFQPSMVNSNSSQTEQVFPQRPGQLECQHYVKTGDCKFGTSCRYHHPADPDARDSNIVLSPIGLPLRPGTPICTHFQQRGICKFGSACRFDHPMREQINPVGLGTSSSSSDIRSELIPMELTTSTSATPSTSVGSTISKDYDSISHSTASKLSENQNPPSDKKVSA